MPFILTAGRVVYPFRLKQKILTTEDTETTEKKPRV